MPKINRNTCVRAVRRWIDAIERAEHMRSVSAMVESACELGCRCTGGRYSPPTPLGLVDAEEAVELCDDLERRALREKFGRQIVVQERTAVGGRTVTVDRIIESPDDHVAVRMHIERDAARRLVASALHHVRLALLARRGVQ